MLYWGLQKGDPSLENYPRKCPCTPRVKPTATGRPKNRCSTAQAPARKIFERSGSPSSRRAEISGKEESRESPKLPGRPATLMHCMFCDDSRAGSNKPDARSACLEEAPHCSARDPWPPWPSEFRPQPSFNAGPPPSSRTVRRKLPKEERASRQSRRTAQSDESRIGHRGLASRNFFKVLLLTVQPPPQTPSAHQQESPAHKELQRELDSTPRGSLVFGDS